MERARVKIFDTTLRDGEQSPGCSMNLQEKLRMARQLDRLGVDIIEAGFPIASDGDFEAVRAIAHEIRRPVIAGLARAITMDIDRAWQAVRFAAKPRMHVFLVYLETHSPVFMAEWRWPIFLGCMAVGLIISSYCLHQMERSARARERKQ